ncbi:MAG: YigZ family protein [Bacteroidales bacterium]|nr:YigZ family protein [Bacteroidales bacterium]
MENDVYRTLEGISRGLYTEKGSKVIAVASGVTSVEEVRQHLDSLRREFHDARHHCYAYRLGDEPYEYRYQDDGEPSGTAGKPIYGQIQSFDLTDVLIVVIRYFGGVKLGTGGLITAYRAAARDAIENGAVVNKIRTSRLGIVFDYEKMNDVMRIIKEENLRILNQESELKCRILLEIRRSNIEAVKNKFVSLEMFDMTVI